jgi:Rrf2 family transcriptional regulator, cysteine metabolism repressor
MKLSTKSRYGTRAMIEIAAHYQKGPVKRKDIAKSQDISTHYLENILIALKSRNLIRTVRGAEGGFTLSKEPEKITMYDIMTALEGSIAPVHCVESPARCKRSENCVPHVLWKKLHDAQMKVLKETNLQSLLDLGQTMRSSDYSI